MLSIGYETLTPPRLTNIVTRFDLVVVDVRSAPSGRVRRGFSRADLQTLFADRYVWLGDVLGGRRPIQPVGLETIRRMDGAPREVLLLCQEHAPWDCHRHTAIATALLPELDVAHIMDDDVMMASSVQSAIVRAGESESIEVGIACTLDGLAS